MKFHKLVWASILATSLTAPAMPSSAQWSASQRDDFTSVCADACRRNPRVPEAHRSQCDDYCDCVRAEGEKFLNEAQYDQMMKDFAARKQTSEVKQFVDLTPICNNKAFGKR